MNIAISHHFSTPTPAFGTDGPGFYARLGAVVHERPRADYWLMRFEL